MKTILFSIQLYVEIHFLIQKPFMKNVTNEKRLWLKFKKILCILLFAYVLIFFSG